MAEQRRVVAALPGQGWGVTYTWADGATSPPEPIVGWLVYDDGQVDPPVAADPLGSVETLDDVGNVDRLHPPGGWPQEDAA